MTFTLTPWRLTLDSDHDLEDCPNAVALGRFMLIFMALCAPALGYALAEIFG